MMFNQIKMNSKNKYKSDKGVGQGNANETKDDHTTQIVSSIEYYTDWTTEKSTKENTNPEKNVTSKEPPSIGHQRRNSANKHKKMIADSNVSASYNEIYNRAELFIFP
jgi:hypothetical protein